MTTKIACYTLFDITKTGVINRSTLPVNENAVEWTKKRNTQCNYDTVLQVISLRSQPEPIDSPQKIKVTKEIQMFFGSEYKWTKNSHCWRFEFEVQHPSVFNNGIHEIGALFTDSNGVPMILVGNEVAALTTTLSTSQSHKNIHYEVI